ncbi:FAD-binding oxidoreductase [Celeribacter halophilus]|uniref:FAD/FMN-containing dehydrogenase n=1 Tax=Celeribacter halophilus TaxID=576117 RepID=A0A1I3U7U3_9RHOB|nr:FAD-binding oxidoreductase [Celeribacter halophilus]MBU2888791.1 FAD-binding oxidoreductase [Celeribacter halophilus]MDO6511786.1 FAD-binding oxidoreductase [Celeribacter halophilus]MDO6724568.1 FAD-binding oxidoreductase [Celeribacter halophilus]PZX10237.1 FAD/FMN-containing dehydrogenase [Celeribacter halophilus]SFJ78783.1 FAD/FMN-containing dehydrogenase [Celeribacter halophilus]
MDAIKGHEDKSETRAEFVQALEARLGCEIVVTGTDVAVYCRDWHGDIQSDAVAVLRPRSTAEVQDCVRAAIDLGLQVVPQGGNTGLVLGAVPDAPDRQVVVSLERMTKIRSLDADNFSAVVEAGIVLEDLKEKVAQEGLYFPLALGAQGSCRLGGNVATNAGGVNVLRYGMTRELLLGLEVVLPDGSLFEGLNCLRKDNRGIDLKQLFIGSEGTLGIITAVSVKLLPAPEQVATALLALGSLEDAITLYRRARRQCCDLMSAFEFMPPIAFELAKEGMPDLVLPMQAEYPAYVLMELSGSGLVDIDDLMVRFVEFAFEEGLALDGVIATSQAQARNLWLIREGMNEGQAKRGKHLRTDISVPLSRMAEFVSEVEAKIGTEMPDAICVSYGHVGDGNVHLNVLPGSRGDVDEQIYCAKQIANEVLDRYNGSISAEHGIGRLKKDDFSQRLTDVHRRLLESVRSAIDPALTMNRGCQIDL